MSLRKSAVLPRAASTRRRSIQSVIGSAIEMLEPRQLLAAQLTVVNPDAVPGSYNRLVFNTIASKNPNYPNEVHSTQEITLENTGDAALTISSVTTSGPFSVALTSGGSFSDTTLQPGGKLNLTVTFTQTSLPAHSTNETNYNNNTNGGAYIDGTLTIESNDPNTPVDTYTLAGYWQSESENNAEPAAAVILNDLYGFDTTLITSSQVNSTYPTDFPNNANSPVYYGQEVASTAWTAANTGLPVTLTEVAGYHTEGNTVNVYWYSAANANNSTLLYTLGQDQGQTLLPSPDQSSSSQSSGDEPAYTATINTTSAFGIRVDDEYSSDAVNIANNNSGGGGHHFRFYPLIGSDGQAVPNAWIVTMDYAVIQSENYDFQDNIFILTNAQPTNAPSAPTNLTATSATHPTLNWSPVTYASGLAGYNVYRATDAAGPYTLLTSSPITTTTYTDTTAPTGQTLYYQVTAVSTASAPNESAPATVTANTPSGPVAGSFTLTATGGSAVSINVLAHASDTSGSILASSVTIGNFSAGTGTVNPTTGVVTYTPPASFNGNTTYTATFTYTVTDSNNLTSAPGTVTVNVVPASVSKPEANPDVALVLSGQPEAINVLANDLGGSAGFNLSTLTVGTSASGTPPTHGTAVANADGTITYTPAAGYVGQDSFSYSIKDNSGNSVSSTVTVNVGVALTPNAASPIREVTYTDTNGTPVTVILTRGTADIYFSGSGTAPGAANRGVLILGGKVAAADIALSGTTAASTLVISGARNGVVDLGSITDASPIGAIVASTADFDVDNGSTASIELAGGTKELVLGATGNTASSSPNAINLGSPSGLTLTGGSAISNDIVLIRGNAGNTSLDSSLPLNVVEATKWTNTLTDVLTNITAPAINVLLVRGEFDPSLTITGNAAVGLGTASITGPVTSGYWDITGGARTISFGSIGNTWAGADVSQTLSTFVVRAGGLPANVTAGAITTASIGGNLTGGLNAGTARVVRVTGSIAGASLDFSGSGTSLSTLSVAGSITDSTVDAAGSIGVLVAGSLNGSTVTAGIANPSSVTLSTVTAANIGAATIGAAVLTSRAGYAFADSTLIAHTITIGELGTANTGNGGTPEGVAFASTRSLIITANGTLERFGPTSSSQKIGDLMIDVL